MAKTKFFLDEKFLLNLLYYGLCVEQPTSYILYPRGSKKTHFKLNCSCRQADWIGIGKTINKFCLNGLIFLLWFFDKYTIYTQNKFAVDFAYKTDT